VLPGESCFRKAGCQIAYEILVTGCVFATRGVTSPPIPYDV